MATSSGKADIHEDEHPNEVHHELTVKEVEETVQDYAKASVLAKEAGFDGVHIHCGNGYLPDQFIQSKTNHCTDKHGGSIKNCCRFPIEIVEGIIVSGSYPSDRIGLKVTPNGNFGDMGSSDNHETFIFLTV